jgi:hypothetical protein
MNDRDERLLPDQVEAILQRACTRVDQPRCLKRPFAEESQYWEDGLLGVGVIETTSRTEERKYAVLWHPTKAKGLLRRISLTRLPQGPDAGSYH